MLDTEVHENTNIMDLKSRIEGMVGEGRLFRIFGRVGNPNGESEFKLVHHGQVLEDYDTNASQAMSRCEEVKRKMADKKRQRVAMETVLKDHKAEHDGVMEETSSFNNEREREREKEIQKQVKLLKQEEDHMEKMIETLEKKTVPQKVKDYYIDRRSMVIIVPAKARLGIFGIRVNYVGETLQVRHSRCEHVAAIIRDMRSRFADRLPKDSDDFKMHHALYWRCAPTKMVKLDPSKCLCEYGITEDNTVFEHDIEKVPVSSLARSQFSGIRRKSKLKSLVNLPRERKSPAASRRSKSLTHIAKPVENPRCSLLPESLADDLPVLQPSEREAYQQANDARRTRRALQREGSRARGSSSLSTASTLQGPTSSSSNSEDSSSDSEQEVSLQSSETLVGSAGRALRPSSGSSQGSFRSSMSRSGSAPALHPSYGPSQDLVDLSCVMNSSMKHEETEQLSSSLLSTIKKREKLAKQEVRAAKKVCKDAKKKMHDAERQRAAAEGQAARAQALARAAEAEIEQARLAQRYAEELARKHAHLRMERIVERAAQNATSNLPPIDKKPDCVVCMDAPAEVMAYPCGHRCYCPSCADLAREEFAARQAARGDKKCTRCPVCREPAVDLVRVY